ncbi:conserved hypothetical protein [delta proteobacterium NaphS2]|nr:conserved hypothetical protein [delta proteobacterium NaphS2]
MRNNRAGTGACPYGRNGIVAGDDDNSVDVVGHDLKRIG